MRARVKSSPLLIETSTRFTYKPPTGTMKPKMTRIEAAGNLSQRFGSDQDQLVCRARLTPEPPPPQAMPRTRIESPACEAEITSPAAGEVIMLCTGISCRGARAAYQDGRG
jgi:hypothetical protein